MDVAKTQAELFCLTKDMYIKRAIQYGGKYNDWRFVVFLLLYDLY